ncbi:hypothetical protein KP509_04G047100 [Ceratopteris richardii]|nr:hypothetical protein KP509_04G047100 [Ceratopteris richardii]
MKRKLSKKLQFLSKLQETQSILATKKKISKKRHRSKKSVLNNLSSIAEVLPEIKEKTEKQFHLPKGSQAKARQKLVITEVKQLSMVLDHPRFKQNPFAAIHEHLKVSLDPVKEDPLKPLKDKRAEKQNKQRRRLAPVKMEE